MMVITMVQKGDILNTHTSLSGKHYRSASTKVNEIHLKNKWKL